jgi:hypothetical protein
MAKRFEERVTSYVEQQLEGMFTGGKPPDVPVFRLAAGGLGVAALGVLLLAGIVVIVILLVKLAF